jgi:hypothetical protein
MVESLSGKQPTKRPQKEATNVEKKENIGEDFNGKRG